LIVEEVVLASSFILIIDILKESLYPLVTFPIGLRKKYMPDRTRGTLLIRFQNKKSMAIYRILLVRPRILLPSNLGSPDLDAAKIPPWGEYPIVGSVISEGWLIKYEVACVPTTKVLSSH
jgi:hypothetical protein